MTNGKTRGPWIFNSETHRIEDIRMNIQSEIRSALIAEMVDAGELIRKGEDYYEDMGGHLLHESHLDPFITNWMQHMDPEERIELVNRLGCAIHK